MMENRSYDHYFGWYAKGDGRNAGLSYPDDQGVMHPTHPLAPDFQGCGFNDPNHEWEGARVEYDNGALDGFYKASDAYALGYYLERDIPFLPGGQELHALRPLFRSLLGPTWPNRLYQHSAQSGARRRMPVPQDAANAYSRAGCTAGRRSGTACSSRGWTASPTTTPTCRSSACSESASPGSPEAGLRVLRRRSGGAAAPRGLRRPAVPRRRRRPRPLRRRAPARGHQDRPGLHVEHRPRLHGLAPVPSRGALRQLRRVGRLL